MMESGKASSAKDISDSSDRILRAFPSVRAVLFDAVGTLLFPRPTVADVYHAAGLRLGSQLSQEQVQARFREAFTRQEEIDAVSGGGITSEEREKRRWRTIIAETFDDVGRADELFDVLWEHFAQPTHWQVFPDVPDALERLENCGLSWGIASNFDRRLERLCEGLAPLDRCRRVFASSRLGFRKPSRNFFAVIEQQMGLHPEELLLVGDDLENDFSAARAAGWHAVLLTRENRSDVGEAHAIASLDEFV